MSVSLSLEDLLAYTDWERARWREWFAHHGSAALAIPSGPNGDGRFQTLGELVRHVFSAERRYVDRLRGQEPADTSRIATDSAKPLFEFGEQSRRGFRAFIESMPADEWDTPHEFQLMTFRIRATPRKIAAHILMHEIRHWAQISTLARLAGLRVEFHDFLASPVFGGEFVNEAG
jgi:uncharacterized damage-inducible protein DinB